MLMSVGHTLWSASGLESGMSFQSIQINGKELLQRYLPAPSAYDACACSVARNCPDPAWSGAQFLCHYGNNCTIDTVIWSIPGFIRSCTVADSIYSSDLRCFFDKTCLNTLLSMYNVDMPNRDPLPSATLNINVLDSSTLVSFLRTDTIEKIFGELMVDHWDIRTNYGGYYNSCAPAKCIYTFNQRMDLFYVLTMITTFFGGLAVTIRLLSPICVRFIYWIYTYRQNNHSNINDRRSMELSRGKYILLLNSKM